MTPAEITAELATIRARVEELARLAATSAPMPPAVATQARRRREAAVFRLDTYVGSIAFALGRAAAAVEALHAAPEEDRRVA